jgi:hypothetical protein
MMSRFGSRAATTAVVAALALMIPMAAVADAPDTSGVVERTPSELHWLWAGDGLFVLEGPPIAQGCLGEGFEEYTEAVVTTPAGVVTVSTDSPPEPLAQGTGRVSANSRVDADGAEHIRSRVTATVTTADGRSVHLDAHGEAGVFPDVVHYGG